MYNSETPSNDSVVGKTISSKIADRIRDDILSRRIEPFSRITAKEIADKYGVSSMPVREAFNVLCGENLLDLSPYKGAVVMPVTPKMMAELNDLQCALECLLIELCIKKGYSNELLEQIEKVNKDMEACMNDEDWQQKRLDLNTLFHTLVYSPCKDHIAYKEFEKNFKLLVSIRRYYKMDVHRSKESVAEHQKLIAAIRSKDIVTAVAMNRQHSIRSKEYVLSEDYNK